jgi:hypothetical protein
MLCAPARPYAFVLSSVERYAAHRSSWPSCLVNANPAKSQNDLTRVFGAEDAEIPTPAIRATLGQQDTGALQELIDYLKAVNLVSWNGFSGSGTFVAPATDGGNGDQASVSVVQGDQFRLDVHTQTGIERTRIADTYGVTMDASGRRWPIPRATAKTGLFYFPRLLTSSFPTPTTRLIDQGQVQVAGQLLHRITVCEPLTNTQQTDTDPTRLSLVDLYFDTTSHLLIKSAASIQLDSADRARYVQVITYGDYRAVQSGLIPFQIHQSLNGQAQWTLQLSDATLTVDTNSSDFYFLKRAAMKKLIQMGLCLGVAMVGSMAASAQNYVYTTGSPVFSSQIPIENQVTDGTYSMSAQRQVQTSNHRLQPTLVQRPVRTASHPNRS